MNVYVHNSTSRKCYHDSLKLSIIINETITYLMPFGLREKRGDEMCWKKPTYLNLVFVRHHARRIEPAGQISASYHCDTSLRHSLRHVLDISTSPHLHIPPTSRHVDMSTCMKVDLGQNVRLVVSLWRYVVSL